MASDADIDSTDYYAESSPAFAAGRRSVTMHYLDAGMDEHDATGYFTVENKYSQAYYTVGTTVDQYFDCKYEDSELMYRSHTPCGLDECVDYLPCGGYEDHTTDLAVTTGESYVSTHLQIADDCELDTTPVTVQVRTLHDVNQEDGSIISDT